jgi:hypothetical protein
MRHGNHQTKVSRFLEEKRTASVHLALHYDYRICLFSSLLSLLS